MEPRAQHGSMVMDSLQGVLEWDHGAEAMLGVSAGAAKAGACYQVVRGTDAAGRRVCGPDCPAFAKLQAGGLRASSALRLADGSRVTCRLTALPAPGGGAIASLTRVQGRRGAPVGETSLLDDLAAQATIVGALATLPLELAIERSLELIREATGADVAELFLAEPGNQALVLSGHRGPFRGAFSQQLRFELGQGIPGKVLATHAPVLSAPLRDDPDYLREDVKEADFRAYGCVPLVHAGEVVGTIGLAFRRERDDLQHQLGFLGWLSGPLGSAVQAAMVAPPARSFTQGAEELGAAAQLEGQLDKLLRRMVDATGAEAGELRLLPATEGGGPAGHVLLAAECPPECPVLDGGSPAGCPVVAERRVAVHAGRLAQPPLACRRSGMGGRHLCIPLVADGTVWGLAWLWQRTHRDVLPTRGLVLAEAMAEAAAPAIHASRLRYQAQERYRRLLADVGQTVAGVGARSSIGRAVQADVPRHRLDLRSFGTFELRVAGQVVPPKAVKRKRTLMLLKILVAQHGSPVGRDALVEWLWPGGDPRSKASQLYVLVHELRRVIEPDGDEGPPRHVLTEGDRYLFDPGEDARVDAWEFRRLAEAAAWAQARGDLAAAAAAGEAAVGLYRGDFMADEPYAQWCWQQREVLRETCLDALQRLAAGAGGLGDLSGSVRHLRTAVHLDPLREGVHRDLMRALWAAGKRDEAVQQYRVCEELLGRELGVRPLPETAALLARIKAEPTP